LRPRHVPRTHSHHPPSLISFGSRIPPDHLWSLTEESRTLHKPPGFDPEFDQNVRSIPVQKQLKRPLTIWLTSWRQSSAEPVEFLILGTQPSSNPTNGISRDPKQPFPACTSRQDCEVPARYLVVVSRLYRVFIVFGSSSEVSGEMSLEYCMHQACKTADHVLFSAACSMPIPLPETLSNIDPS
jgi:hypothetical protein